MVLDFFENNGIPKIGIGTWMNTHPEQCALTVRRAIDMGYRHIDTAQVYENEEHVGQGIKDSSVNREKLFVATKVWLKKLDYDGVIESTEESLRKLDMDYVDLLYVHWPAGSYRAKETLDGFNELLHQGKIRKIGVSNFSPELLTEALGILNEPIFGNQVEMHPWLPQRELHSLCREKGIYIVAYSPFVHGEIFTDPFLQNLAKDAGVTVAQLVLNWLVNKEGVVPIPKASGPRHLKENLEVLDQEIGDEIMDEIDRIDKRVRYIDPPFGPWD